MKMRYKGFTLIELMIVVAIMGILSAMVIITGSFQNENNKKEAVVQTVKEEEFGKSSPYILEYHIPNPKRQAGDRIEMVKHSNGQLFGCFVKKGDCYPLNLIGRDWARLHK